MVVLEEWQITLEGDARLPDDVVHGLPVQVQQRLEVHLLELQALLNAVVPVRLRLEPMLQQ